MKKILPLLIICLALTGCTMAPKYQRPEAPISQTWPTGPAYGTNQTAAGTGANLGWRQFFNDARLVQLIELALANNRDLRVAALNVERSQAQYRITRSDLFPSVNAFGAGARQRIPAELSGIGRAVTASQYSVGLGVTAYELDLFGRVRSLKAQALENYFATEQARRSVQISLIAEVAIQYLNECALAEQLSLSRQTLQAVEANYRLIEQSHRIGNTSELDVRSADAQVQTTRASVANYLRQRAQAENALVLLVGQPLSAELVSTQPLSSQKLRADLPPGLPSDLLQRRPDILEAEHLLKAANANIGAARAAFFPRITLTGSAGSASLQLSSLFSGGSAAWNFSPQITLPIFEGGRNVANLDVSKLNKRIEVAQYERTIQAAFREVADALAARATLEEQIDALEALVQAQQQRFNLAEVRYRNGVESYLTVLTAQQDLFQAQQSLIQSLFLRLSNLVDLYKALGGGWQEQSPVAASHQSAAEVPQ